MGELVKIRVGNTVKLKYSATVDGTSEKVNFNDVPIVAYIRNDAQDMVIGAALEVVVQDDPTIALITYEGKGQCFLGDYRLVVVYEIDGKQYVSDTPAFALVATSEEATKAADYVIDGVTVVIDGVLVTSVDAEVVQRILDECQEATRLAEAAGNNPPRIGDNGNWERWNGAKYEDTGVKAQGPEGQPGTDGTDGQNGADGKDGKSVTEVVATVDESTGIPSATVTVGDASDGGTKLTFEFKNIKGEKGEKGDAFTYSDFSPEQLEALKGAPGKDGEDGAPGTDGKDGKSVTEASASINNETGIPSVDVEVGEASDGQKKLTFTFKNLKGATGGKGDTGNDGKSVSEATAIVDGNVGVPGVVVKRSAASDGGIKLEFEFSNLKGETGEPGRSFAIKGYFDTLEALRAAVPNPAGGDAYGVGASEPYDIYIYDEIKKDWVNNGPIQGPQGKPGTDGKDGKSITQAEASIDANVGIPEVEASLSDGDDGQKKLTLVFKNLKGEPGTNGQDGATGAKGEPGADGKSVTSATATINDATGTPEVTVNVAEGEDGQKKLEFAFKNLKGAKGDAFEYSDFTEEQLAALKGEPGKDGVDGKSVTEAAATVDANVGDPSVDVQVGKATDGGVKLTFSFKNIKGQRGADGSNGSDGSDGADGKSITKVIATVDENTGIPSVEANTTDGIDGQKELTLTFKNLKGEPGKDGEPGATGNPGKDGTDGKSVTTATATIDNAIGTPEVTVNVTDGEDGQKKLEFGFKNMKGAKGDKGDQGFYEEQNAGSGALTKRLAPNTHYVFGQCSSLTITFGATTPGITNEYSFEFTSGTTPTTLRLPTSVKWEGIKGDIQIQASKKYIVSILNNLAVWGEFAK